MAEFKDRLEEALKLRDMKPAELARVSGVTEGTISQYRKGAYPVTSTIEINLKHCNSK